MYPKSTLHALRCCPTLKKIRARCSFMNNFKVNERMHFMDFMITCKNHLMSAEMELFCMVIWHILLRRNGQGSLKRIHDVVIDASKGKLEIGIIVRDSNGDILTSSVQPVAGLSPAVADPVAIQRGLLFIIEIGWAPYTLISDAQTCSRPSRPINRLNMASRLVTAAKWPKSVSLVGLRIIV
ncbi:hypothetical protein Ddye_016781 [Dipteronia dyeriana]|uniref:RNase H type-1 domain-containing protein n=1 Tax=Dipteronia dyeriana TaxID=168575 RepID=A0AAD9X0N1_9ROSI|nr:hypothetical protein Ddye_016781 [Dipteronia dyeriana]